MFRVFYCHGAYSRFHHATEFSSEVFASLEEARECIASCLLQDSGGDGPHNYWIVQIVEEHTWKAPEVKIEAPQEAQ